MTAVPSELWLALLIIVVGLCVACFLARRALNKFGIYLSTLKWPESWSDFYDLLSKTVIALIAVSISYFAYGAAKALQDRRNDIDFYFRNIPSNMDDINYSMKLNILSGYCDEEKITNRAIGKMCVELSKLAHEYQTYQAKKQPGPATKTTSGLPTQLDINSDFIKAQNNILPALEAGTPADPNGKWFSVVATVPLDYKNSLPSIISQVKGFHKEWDVCVYQTSGSNVYTVTSGKRKSESDAAARAADIRAERLAPAAFAQPDRNWRYIAVDGATGENPASFCNY